MFASLRSPLVSCLRSTSIRSKCAPYSTAVPFSIFSENSLNSLIKDLKISLPEKGVEEPTKVKQILNLLRMYETKEADWSQYAIRDKGAQYTRNLITEIQGHSKLLVLVWEPGKGSKLHSHPNTDCFVKVLKGQLQEDLYDPKPITKDPILQRTTTLPFNSVAFITDDIGSHQIRNNTRDIAISLHLYVPQTKNLGLPGSDVKVVA